MDGLTDSGTDRRRGAAPVRPLGQPAPPWDTRSTSGPASGLPVALRGGHGQGRPGPPPAGALGLVAAPRGPVRHPGTQPAPRVPSPPPDWSALHTTRRVAALRAATASRRPTARSVEAGWPGPCAAPADRRAQGSDAVRSRLDCAAPLIGTLTRVLLTGRRRARLGPSRCRSPGEGGPGPAPPTTERLAPCALLPIICLFSRCGRLTSAGPSGRTPPPGLRTSGSHQVASAWTPPAGSSLGAGPRSRSATMGSPWYTKAPPKKPSQSTSGRRSTVPNSCVLMWATSSAAPMRSRAPISDLFALRSASTAVSTVWTCSRASSISASLLWSASWAVLRIRARDSLTCSLGLSDAMLRSALTRRAGGPESRSRLPTTGWTC
jgi:hypothetical protein